MRTARHTGGTGCDLAVGEFEIEALGDGPRHRVGGLQYGCRVLRFRRQRAAPDGETHGLGHDGDKLGRALGKGFPGAAAEDQDGGDVGTRGLRRDHDTADFAAGDGLQRLVEPGGICDLDDSGALDDARDEIVGEGQRGVGKAAPRVAAGRQDLGRVVGPDDKHGGRRHAQRLGDDLQRLLHGGFGVAILVETRHDAMQAVQRLFVFV